MLTAASAAAAVDLCMAIIALQIFPFLVLAPQLGPGAADPASAAQAPLLDSTAVELLLPLAALLTAVAVIYHNLHHTPAGAGAGNYRRLWESFAVLCASAGTLDFFLFVQPAGLIAFIGGGDAVAAAQVLRALGLAAARVLPAAAAATFFLGMALIIVAHIRAGGEGGGGGAFAADGGQQIQGPVPFLTKAAYAAAAALAGLMVMALCACGDTAMY